MRIIHRLVLTTMTMSALAACDRTVPKKPTAPTANKTPNKTTGGLRLISQDEGTPGFTVDDGPGYSMLRYTVTNGITTAPPSTPGVYLFHGVIINGGAVIESCNKKVDCLEAGLFNPTADGSIVFQPTQAMIDGASLSLAGEPAPMISFKLMAGDAPEPTAENPLPDPTGMTKLSKRCAVDDTTDSADCVRRAPAFRPTTSPMTLEETAVRSLLAKYQAVSAISGPLAGQLRGQPNAVLTAISEAIISVRALPQSDLQTFIDSLTGAITSDSAANKLKAISALRPFISTWDTTKFGSDNMVTLGLVSNGTYDFTVDWGDATTQTVTTWNSPNKTHTYSTPGNYIVKITGTITGWMVDSAPPGYPFDQHAGQHQNLMEISNWGQFKFGQGAQHFRNATNLKITARDIPVLGGSLSNSFAGCLALVTVPNMEKWDTSKVTDMGFLFINSPAFNQPIGGWDTSKVTQMAFVFSGAEAFNQPIGGWDTSSVTGMVYTFLGAKAFNQDISSWKTSKVTEMAGMFYNAWAFNNGVAPDSTEIHPLTFDTSAVWAMNGMFIGAKAFNQPIDHNPATGSWNTSNVTTMNGMFSQTEAFNQPIGGWDTAKVTDMNAMFDAAHAFNQPINHNQATGSWNTSLVTDMAYMFRNAWAFNQDIHGWDTSKVTKMHGMFQYATAFNQNINHSTATGSWNTAAVTNMYGMFNAATAFNNGASGSDVGHPLAFNTAAVTDMSWMFSQASAFNQRLDLSDTSNVANMLAMFHLAAAFNNGASGSDVSHTLAFNTPAVLNMASMFQQASAFNQPLHLTDTSKVTLMSHMFNGATAFNQPIGGWDTSKVTTMFAMFFYASAFDQNIANWAVGAVVDHAYFSDGSPLSSVYKPAFN